MNKYLYYLKGIDPVRMCELNLTLMASSRAEASDSFKATYGSHSIVTHI